jgi:hypothetical protein
MAKQANSKEVLDTEIEIELVDKDCNVEVILDYKDLKVGQVYNVSASVANALLTKRIVKVI